MIESTPPLRNSSVGSSSAKEKEELIPSDTVKKTSKVFSSSMDKNNPEFYEIVLIEAERHIEQNDEFISRSYEDLSCIIEEIDSRETENLLDDEVRKRQLTIYQRAQNLCYIILDILSDLYTNIKDLMCRKFSYINISSMPFYWWTPPH